jgi:hypothetical protein
VCHDWLLGVRGEGNHFFVPINAELNSELVSLQFIRATFLAEAFRITSNTRWIYTDPRPPERISPEYVSGVESAGTVAWLPASGPIKNYRMSLQTLP